MSYWVVYYKCTAEATSSIRHDGAAFCLNQAVVPADHEDQAIELLRKDLAVDKIIIQEIRSISKYENFDLSNNVFELPKAHEESVLENQIVTALFVPSDALEYINLKQTQKVH